MRRDSALAAAATIAILGACTEKDATSPATSSPDPATANPPVVDNDPVPPPSVRPMPETLLRAIALIEQGRFDEARAITEPLVAADPNDAQAVFVHGLTYHRARDYAAAEPMLVRVIEIDPSYAVVHHFLGYCRFYLGDLTGARESFEAHLRSAPDETDSHFGVGLVDLEEGRLDDAEKRFRYVTRLVADAKHAGTLNPRLQRDAAKAYARLGDIAFAREQYEEARTLVRRAVAIDPNQYASYYTLSQIERRLGNDDEADRMQTLFDQMAAARHGKPPREPGE